MKIISWNVAGIKSCIKKDCLDFIKKENADIYCLQEVKSKDVPFIEGYKTFNFPAKRKGYSGVLVYSKYKPLSVRYGMGRKDFDDKSRVTIFDDEGRVIVLEFKSFYLVAVYFPHSRRNLSRLNFKLRFDKQFEEFCKNLSRKKPLIIAGDFNVAHKEIDLANPKQNMKNAGFTPEERAWFDEFLKQGFVDAFREFVKEGSHYTWWSYRNNCRQRNIGWRIDYFVVSEALKDKLKSSKILKDVMGSDHCPILLELK